MLEENNKKTNFFKQAFKSVKDLDKYEDFAAELPKDAFKYLLKLILIFTIIVTAFYSYKIVDSLNFVYSNLKSVVPEFSYSKGELTVSEKQPIVLEQFEKTIGKVIIDTNTTADAAGKYKEQIKENKVAVLILKDQVIMKANDTEDGQVAYKYSDIVNSYGISADFTKQDVVNYIDGMNVIYIYFSIFVVMFIYLFIIYFMAIFIDVIILTLLAFIVSRITRIRLKLAPSFNIAVHGITLPALLNLGYIIVNLLTGFDIKYFQFMYTTIAYIYVIVAILMIKTDFINRQIELMKIAEEQEKVREELKKQKEEKEKKKEEENKDKEKKPEENKGKKKKHKEDDGELEGGVNPSVIQEKQ